MDKRALENELRLITVSINRMCTTEDVEDLINAQQWAKRHIDRIYEYNRQRVRETEKEPGEIMGKYPWSGRRTLDHCGLITRYQDLLGRPRQQDGKCDGYQKSEGDDEPCETCMECKLNTFYED